MRWFLMMIIALALLVPALAGSNASAEMNLKTELRALPHDIIRINNDTQLEEMANVSGWQGNGSASNPYVIENYIIDAHGNTSAIFIGNVTKYVLIRNCTVYNVTTVQSYGWGSGVMIYRTSNVVIENLTAHDVVQYGVYIGTDSSYVTVENSHFYPGSTDYMAGIVVSGGHALLINNTIEGSIAGIWIYSAYYTTLYSNTLLNTSIRIDYGYYADQFTIPLNNTVNGKSVRYVRGFEDNKTLDASAFGEVILGKVTWLRVANLSMSRIGTGLIVLDSSHIKIENVSLTNISGVPVEGHLSDNVSFENLSITGSGAQGMRFLACEDFWISNSTITGNRFSNGIYLNGARRITINHVNISGVTDGVYFYGSANENITLKDSYLYDFSNYGLFANSGTTSLPIKEVYVLNNKFVNNGYDAVYLSTVDGALVSGNHIWSSVWSPNINGVRLIYYTKNVIIEHNLFEDLQTGVVLSSADYSKIRNNTFQNQSYTGISMYSSVNDIVECNVINGSHAYGIMLSSASNSNIIRRNLITNSTLYGVYLQSGTNYNRIYNNSFYFNHGSNATYNASHVQAYDASGANYWNTTAPSGGHGYGNFWYDWQSPDNDSNEIVDTPYAIDGGAGAEDYYPLTTAPVVPEFSFLILLFLPLVLLLRRRSP